MKLVTFFAPKGFPVSCHPPSLGTLLLCLYQKMQELPKVVVSGDDSLGHSAKYGVYTLFSDSMSKIVLRQMKYVLVNKWSLKAQNDSLLH